VVRQDVSERLRTKGLQAMRPDEGVAALATLMRAAATPQVSVLRGDWTQLGTNARGQVTPFYSIVAAAPRAASAGTNEPNRPSGDVVTEWRTAPVSHRRRRIQEFVRQQLDGVLGLDRTFVIDPQFGIRDLGIDSLMSIELRNRLQAGIGRPLPSTLIFDHPTLAALTDFVAQVLGLDLAEPPAVPSAAREEDTRRALAVAAVDALSDEEAEALLMEELTRKGRGQVV